MNFLDHMCLHVTAGRGGDGLVSFKTARFRPRLGPNGGDGGKGGDVWVRGSSRLHTFGDGLEPRVRGQAGARGGAGPKQGRSGRPIYVDVPLGTLVYKEDRCLGEIIEEGQVLRIAKGGLGGLGNSALATATLRAPTTAHSGEAGEDLRLRLELSLMADVGLVGLPNAGKSSFLRALSRARPEVGDYPFTTLTPQLGVITDGYDRYIMADLPGLIEGAREGKGLGLRFLRHVQRCRGLVYLLDGARPLADQLEVLQREVLGFDASLGQRPFLVIINKIDLDPPPFPGLRMSVKEGTGLSLVQEALWAWVRSLR